MKADRTWQQRPLGEVFDFNPERRLQRGELAPFIGMADLIEQQRIPEHSEPRAYSGGTRFSEGDILFARITPSLENGKTAFIKELPATVGHGSTEFIVIGPRSGISDSLFGYYLCKDQALRSYAVQQMSGSSGRQRVSWQALARYVRAIPSLPEQQRIARILGAIDDRIENNRLRSGLAERVAEAVFADTFLSFTGRATPVPSELGPIPTGWRVLPLTDVLEVNPHTTIRRGEGMPFIEMADVRPWSTRPVRVQIRPVSGGCRFQPEDTLFARIAGCVEKGKGAFIDFLDTAGTGSTEFLVLRAKEPLTPEAVFLLARLPHVREQVMAQMSGSSGRQRVPPGAFGAVKMAVPEDQEAWEHEARLLAASFAKSRALWLESRALTALRDALMPELLSGRLQAPDTTDPEELIGRVREETLA